MKRFLSVAVMTVWTVCGAYGATQAQAEALYKANQFDQAYEAYVSLVRQDPANAELNFLLGRSALETKRYDEALAAFERVLMLDPSHTRTRLEMARVYFEGGQLELASTELERVLGATLPSNIREVVVAFKARVDGAMAKHRVSGSVVAGLGYDTNINNDIGKKEFLIPSFGGLSLEGTKKKSDSFAFGIAALNHSYDIGLRDGWSMEQSGVFYSKLHRHTTENNLALFSLNTAPTFKEGRYSIGLPVGFDKV
ncbi:MAG: tetratricopeptide repeat protein, partial [Campylobacterales bacterium]|nr:tetratricopeptide repeat protein [Campylobacterales bacterium]